MARINRFVNRPTQKGALSALMLNAPPGFCGMCLKVVEQTPCRTKKEKKECQKK